MTLKEFFENDRFAKMAGVELVEIRPGYARAEMPLRPEVLNADGYCQGGALFTLADLAFAAAVNSHGNVTVSCNSNIVFLKGANKGTLHAEAKEVYDHPRLPYAEVRITDDEGNLIAVFTSSGYRKHNQPIPVSSLI